MAAAVHGNIFFQKIGNFPFNGIFCYLIIQQNIENQQDGHLARP
jgi:hypothetical protein